VTSERTAIAILAGGHGTRLWPLSTPQRPKQFVPVLPEGSMLQASFARARRVVDARDILIVGSHEHRQLYLEQLPELPEENLILEPESRGTAACIALTAALEAWRARFHVIVTVPADHVVDDPEDWAAALREGSAYAGSTDELVSIASIPEFPSTKFGYLITGDRVGGTKLNPVNRVIKFVEKPDRQTLESLLSTGQCLRNMGMIAFKPSVLLAELARHAPEIIKSLDLARDQDFDDNSLDAAYSSMPRASIDVSLLQRTNRLSAVSSRIRSIDGGDFISLAGILESDVHGNKIKGQAIMIDSTSNIVFSGDATVAGVGIRDLVIVVDRDTVLVCPKDQSQRIKELADQ